MTTVLPTRSISSYWLSNPRTCAWRPDVLGWMPRYTDWYFGVSWAAAGSAVNASRNIAHSEARNERDISFAPSVVTAAPIARRRRLGGERSGGRCSAGALTRQWGAARKRSGG